MIFKGERVFLLSDVMLDSSPFGHGKLCWLPHRSHVGRCTSNPMMIGFPWVLTGFPHYTPSYTSEMFFGTT